MDLGRAAAVLGVRGAALGARLAQRARMTDDGVTIAYVDGLIAQTFGRSRTFAAECLAPVVSEVTTPRRRNLRAPRERAPSIDAVCVRLDGAHRSA